jgi:SAM-dependent methyltransferase
MTSFEDHFSGLAKEYAQYRPHYPSELFTYLASVCPERRVAWDCGTGNGQAAVELAAHFSCVIATDASATQIAQAVRHERVSYLVEQAEDAGFKSACLDLITVAVAVHWFDMQRFYMEVRRVLIPGGIIAVWTYHLAATEPAIDRVVEHLYGDVLAGFWPERIQFVHEHYRTLPFPFAELDPPPFIIQAEWNLEQYLGFIDSWSAVRRYRELQGIHPLQLVWEDLLAAWGEPDRRVAIRWPMYLRVGRVQ